MIDLLYVLDNRVKLEEEEEILLPMHTVARTVLLNEVEDASIFPCWIQTNTRWQLKRKKTPWDRDDYSHRICASTTKTSGQGSDKVILKVWRWGSTYRFRENLRFGHVQKPCQISTSDMWLVSTVRNHVEHSFTIDIDQFASARQIGRTTLRVVPTARSWVHLWWRGFRIGQLTSSCTFGKILVWHHCLRPSFSSNEWHSVTGKIAMYEQWLTALDDFECWKKIETQPIAAPTTTGSPRLKSNRDLRIFPERSFNRTWVTGSYRKL